jgi:hypothetical protein
MGIWLDVARVTATLNVFVLLSLVYVWVGNYRQHGADHTLGLIVVGGFLLVENVLWVYFYVLDDAYVDWFVATGTMMQLGLSMLCVLEFAALLFLARLTWR